MLKDCFEDICDCSCTDRPSEFIRILNTEICLELSDRQLFHSNIGWFSDKEICDDSFLGDWGISGSGIYFLWHKNGYCPQHNLFHMKCLYVGKGHIRQRINTHFKRKDFSEEMLVYFTYFEVSNRIAKYLEQLILDLYNIPNNRNENLGHSKLCRYFHQGEVD